MRSPFLCGHQRRKQLRPDGKTEFVQGIAPSVQPLRDKYRYFLRGRGSDPPHFLCANFASRQPHWFVFYLHGRLVVRTRVVGVVSAEKILTLWVEMAFASIAWVHSPERAQFEVGGSICTTILSVSPREGTELRRTRGAERSAAAALTRCWCTQLL